MPNRIIKESICTSDSIDSLGWFDEVVFYRLIVNCDDYGRFDGRLAIIKNRLFPLKDNVTAKSIDVSIHKLATAGLVSLYNVGGKPYLQLPTWDKHQRIRTHKGKFPAPDSNLQTIDSNPPQIVADCGLNPIQSESESQSESNISPSGDFERFWNCYPRKTGKEAARKVFSKVKVPLETLISAVEAQKGCEQWTADNGKYIPYPATWLNQGRWEDELNERNISGTGKIYGKLEAIDC